MEIECVNTCIFFLIALFLFVIFRFSECTYELVLIDQRKQPQKHEDIPHQNYTSCTLTKKTI
jgi:hypothetical protein